MILVDFIGRERPSGWVLQFRPVSVFSFISALIATLLCKNIALKLGIADKPDKLVKIHKGSIVHLGDIGVLARLTVGILMGIYCIGKLRKPVFIHRICKTATC